MKKQSSILIIFIFFFIQGIALNLGHPVTPKFVTTHGIEDYMFGFFYAMMSLGFLLGGLFWGHLGDQASKKKLIATGLFIYGIGQIGFGFIIQGTIMTFFRMFSGFGAAAAVTLLTAQLIESSPEEKRARNLSFGVAFMTIGGSLGYYFGGILGSNSFFMTYLGTSNLSIVFLIQGLFTFFYATLILFFFHFEKGEVKKKQSMIQSLKYISLLKASLLIFFISLTLFTMAKTNVSKYLDVYFNDLGYTTGDLGTFVMATGFVSLFASFILVPIFAKFKNQILVIILVQVFNAIILFFVFRAENFLLTVYTLFMLYVLSMTIYQPLSQNFIASEVKDGKYSFVMGIQQAFTALGQIIAPLIGGFIYQANPVAVFDFSSLLYIIGAILAVVVLILCKYQHPKEYKKIL